MKHAQMTIMLLASTTMPIATGAEMPNGVIGNTLCLNAAAPGGEDPYLRIERTLGKGAVEAPSDSLASPRRAHVEARADDGVVGAHFAILAIEPTDVNLDRVPAAAGGDRSRTEIKLAPSTGGTHEAFKAHQGDSYVYSWRFKLDPRMKFSPGFTHIHQLKAYGGKYSAAPLITFTPLSNGQMEVRHVGDAKQDSSSATVIGSMALDGLAGQWLDVREQISYANTGGRYQLDMRDQTGKSVLAIDQDGLQMWRTGADHIRPKWGIYRKHHAALNQFSDDFVYFANIGIARGSVADSSCR